MSRASRVPYHQNVYDLLRFEPGGAAEAAAMIADHEAACGPLPASLREWYLVPNAVPLHPGRVCEGWDVKRGAIWFEYSNIDNPVALSSVLEEFWNVREVGLLPEWRRHVPRDFVRVMSAHQGCLHWYVADDGSDDPEVWLDLEGLEWRPAGATFSGFLAEWIGEHYFPGRYRDSTPYSRHEPDDQRGFVLPDGPPFEKFYTDGLWLRAAAEPLAVPVLDFLTEELGAPDRVARPGASPRTRGGRAGARSG